jgi:hypothetical protein
MMTNEQHGTGNHLMLDRGLDILDRMVKRMEDGGRIEIADAAMILRFIGSLTQECLSEQSDGLALVSGLEHLLRSKKGRDFVRDSRRLSLMLRTRLQEQELRVARERSIAIPPAEIDARLSLLRQKYATPSNSKTPFQR